MIVSIIQFYKNNKLIFFQGRYKEKKSTDGARQTITTKFKKGEKKKRKKTHSSGKVFSFEK